MRRDKAKREAKSVGSNFNDIHGLREEIVVTNKKILRLLKEQEVNNLKSCDMKLLHGRPVLVLVVKADSLQKVNTCYSFGGENSNNKKYIICKFHLSFLLINSVLENNK